MVSNLLEVSRLERGMAHLELERVDLTAVLERAMATLAPLATEKDVGLALRVAPIAAPVQGNEDKLVEVAINLLDNAVKYSPCRSEVEISVGAVEANRQGFTVRDHGPGLGTIDPDRLFGRFTQGEPSPHSRKHGFGLGLHIVRSYMDLMHGEVRAGNHSDGGALFTCLLPADDPVLEDVDAGEEGSV
jgi:signal transduction histidine kinase